MKGAARAAGLEPGTRLGRYTLLRRLACGGMAELYIAQQHGAAGFEKIVALKRILPHLSEDGTFTTMFLGEARLASNLDHPNLAHVLDFGEYEGEHFLTMEYVHGRNLLQLLKAMGTQTPAQTLPLAAALYVVVQVARGLHNLHEHRSPEGRLLGMVHRDVSPSNVLVSYEGSVKLTDFGIAKAMALTSATQTGTFKGKLGHSSPEQVRGESIDRRSDVFCLGILLYEATTGARAFSGVNEFAVLGKVARGDYVAPTEVDPEYPPQLAAIVDQALQTEAAQRQPTAAAVAEAVEDFAHRAGIRLSPEAVAEAMLGAFGAPPPVIEEQELQRIHDRPTEVAAVVPATLVPAVTVERSRSRSVPVVAAVSLALLTGAAGMWLLGPERSATADEAVATEAPEAVSGADAVARPSADSQVEPEPSGVPSGADAETKEVADPIASAAEAEPAPSDDVSDAVEDASAKPRSARGRSGRKARGKKKKKKSSTKGSTSPSHGLGGLYPPD